MQEFSNPTKHSSIKIHQSIYWVFGLKVPCCGLLIECIFVIVNTVKTRRAKEWGKLWFAYRMYLCDSKHSS